MMREVTKDQFYAPTYAGNLDLVPSIVGSYPYTSVFRYRANLNQRPYGKIVDAVKGGALEKVYYIND